VSLIFLQTTHALFQVFVKSCLFFELVKKTELYVSFLEEASLSVVSGSGLLSYLTVFDFLKTVENKN